MIFDIPSGRQRDIATPSAPRPDAYVTHVHAIEKIMVPMVAFPAKRRQHAHRLLSALIGGGAGGGGEGGIRKT